MIVSTDKELGEKRHGDDGGDSKACGAETSAKPRLCVKHSMHAISVLGGYDDLGNQTAIR